MTRRPARLGLLSGLPALLFAATTGCAAGGPSAPAAGSAQATTSLRVGLLEWQIITSNPGLAAGLDHLTVTNTGTTAHDLYVTGPGVNDHTPLLQPGGSAHLRLTTRAGSTLRLTCEVPGHEEAGMRTTITITR